MFFGKNKEKSELSVFKGILDAQETNIVVANKECKILLINDAAMNHLSRQQLTNNCQDSYASLFNDLCKYCPNRKTKDLSELGSIEIQDKDGVYYSIKYSTIMWLDGKMVTAMFLRNINNERKINEKLYSLAYIDQLTGIANRRKLKEDFDTVAEQITNLKAVGVLAIIDMDNFKTINDSYGHNIGDTMLVRFTSHLEGEEPFRKHLYRLGGDEFVLFYAELENRFQSQKEGQDYYYELLKETLRSYTLPNIEIFCTLSMGVALFPWNGQEFSDLLRKADIALYKAKERGRNQICFFEEAFDSAQKLKDIYINIQPIINGDGQTFGYQLVDQSARGDENDDSLNLNEFDRTMDTLGLEDMEGNSLYFITFSNQLLNKAVAKNLPSNKFVISFQISGESGEKEITKCAELFKLGYSLKIDGVNKQNAAMEILRFASFCSFDPQESDEDFKREFIAGNPAIKFIAIEVNSMFQYEKAKQLGYELFQGFFFNQPNIIKKTKEIDPLKVNYLNLLRMTSTEDHVDFQEISLIISSDVALTYKLLRLLNSAAVGLRNPISSISLAVTYLGELNLKKWIAILAVRGISEDKPMELVRLSLIRAQFGEILCEYMQPKRNPKHVFLLGLLSLLDVALEQSKEDVYNEIPVAEEIKDSLITKTGPYSDLVAFFSDYEYARWEEVAGFSFKNRLTDTQVNSAYITAVKWYNSMLNSIDET